MKYQTPIGYLPWATHLVMWRTLLRAHETGKHLADLQPSIWHSLSVVACAETRKAPPRFLSDGIVAAFLHTPAPSLAPDLPTVLPSMRLFLPLGLLKTEGKSSISVIVVNDVRDPDWQGLQCVGISKAGELYNHFVRFDGKSEQAEDDITPETLNTLEQIRRLAVNSVLVHCYQPELIQEVAASPISSRRGPGFANPNLDGRQALAPVWIGHGFRPGITTPQPGESKHKLRPHWRRGHWHTVAYGEGKRERRQRWFQPVYITGPEG